MEQRKSMKLIYYVLTSFFILISSCKNDDNSTEPEEQAKDLPTVNTFFVKNITETSGKVTSGILKDGGGKITARGVCWSIAENPSITGNKTIDGTGTGEFSSTIAGLTIGTRYFVRAYATNSKGTAYGEQQVFGTAGGGESTFDYNGFTYHTISIGTQEWTVENLRSTT